MRIGCGKRRAGGLAGLPCACPASALVILWVALAAHAQLAVHYNVDFQGVDNAGLRTALERASGLVALKDRPPPTLALLRKRADHDVPKLADVLKAEGYYGVHIETQLDDSIEPAVVTFLIELGDAYPLTRVEVHVAGEESADLESQLPEPEALGLRTGQPAKAAAILAANEKLLRALAMLGYPHPTADKPKVDVDHAARTVAVIYRLTPGPQGKLGPATFTGLSAVDEGFVRNRLPWRPGEPFSPDLIDQARKRLVATGLFASVNVQVGTPLDDDGFVPVTVALSERKHRTIGLGVGYTTDEGAGAYVSWEHRNLRHRGERLELDATVSGIERALEGVYTKPEFRRPDQSLVLRSRLGVDDTDAFRSAGFGIGASLERRLSKQVTVGWGAAFRASRIEQDGDEDRFALLSLPAFYRRDTSDDPLHPTRGARLTLKGAPFQDVSDTGLAFVRASFIYSRYVALSDALILAGRLALGAMAGASRDAVPADERFYAGGGGSIRGYAYQTASPLDCDDDPIGGRSLLEVAAELRIKVSERVGLVTFLDGGRAFESAFPDFDDGLLWGAGLGLRYFSPIGPLRFDVAVPLNRRDIDDSFQIYVSLGHAF